MREYLLFRLYGPMAAWGDIAIGEHRPTHVYPTKSAIMGLIGAAIGIRREEEERHLELSRGYGLAIRMDASGVLLRDYHTVQVPSANKSPGNGGFSTRGEELSGRREDLNTLVTTRDYRCDASCSICVWAVQEPPIVTIGDLAAHLRQPVFPLYLGRKSCPLSLPVFPVMVAVDSFLEAFNRMPVVEDTFLGKLGKSRQVGLYWEGEEAPGIAAVHSVFRRDALLSRKRWQFSNRVEHYSSIEMKPEG